MLSVGDYFGEMALLSAKTIAGVFRRSQRRRCTVRAATVCMLQARAAPLWNGRTASNERRSCGWACGAWRDGSDAARAWLCRC